MHSTSFTPLYKKAYAFMQSSTRAHIALLVEKKLCGTIKPEEEAFLDRWLSQEPEEQVVWNSNETNEPELRKRLLKRIKEDAGIVDYSFPSGNKWQFQRYRWLAVATILVFITGSLSYFWPFKKGVSTISMANNNVETLDIAPGHNGAILTLANGSKIVLDSAGNGKIAMQGNRLLVKKNGQLVYEELKEEIPLKDKNHFDNKVIYNTMTTPRGREFRLMLSDGTEVWLNAASTITYPTAFTGKERKVSITGEVYFEIAKDSQHPFIVSIGKAEITVLGTHFNVMAYPEEKQIKTTLLEGAVKVSRGQQQVIITPGQEASFSKKSGHLNVTKVDVEQAVAWVEGKLSMDNLGVAAIMRKVSRWYDVDVTFEGPVPEAHFWGLINRNVSLSDMLRVMRANGINANQRGNKILVSSDH